MWGVRRHGAGNVPDPRFECALRMQGGHSDIRAVERTAADRAIGCRQYPLRSQPQDAVLAEPRPAKGGAPASVSRRRPDVVLRWQRRGASHAGTRRFPRGVHRRCQGSSLVARRTRHATVAEACAGTDGLHNAADDLPIPRLVALLAHAEGLVTVDSGPAHAGAAVGCPQVVLFGKASTSLYRPWGSAGADVKVLTGQVDGEPNMLGIEARDVMAAWDALELRA